MPGGGASVPFYDGHAFMEQGGLDAGTTAQRWDKPGGARNADEQKQRGQAHLAQLRGLLA